MTRLIVNKAGFRGKTISRTPIAIPPPGGDLREGI